MYDGQNACHHKPEVLNMSFRSSNSVYDSSVAFPAISLGFTTFGEIFNPTIEVATFCLRGWCMLGVFLLLAFTNLGHEQQDLLSLCDRMHVCTD